MMLILNLMFSLIFIFLNHPMTMGLTLLIQTILIATITGMLNMNFWFSYLLFLIMVGGMLVLFIYMTSIASNEMFSYSNKIFINILFLMIIMMMFTFILDKSFMSINYLFIESFNLNTMNHSISKYFNYPSIIMIFFMIIYLFITLVAIVKITKIEFGPLRQKI